MNPSFHKAIKNGIRKTTKNTKRKRFHKPYSDKMYRQLSKLVSKHLSAHPLCQNAQYSASPIAGRTFLPGAEAQTFPKFLPTAHHDFPQIFKARNVKKSDLTKFATNFRPHLDELLHEYGVVLIRGAEVDTKDDFSELVQGLDYRLMRNIPGLCER